MPLKVLMLTQPLFNIMRKIKLIHNKLIINYNHRYLYSEDQKSGINSIKIQVIHFGKNVETREVIYQIAHVLTLAAFIQDVPFRTSDVMDGYFK